MSVGVDLYPVLEASVASLNAVQQEFRFRLTAPAQRQPALLFTREEYVTADLWKFLRDQQEKFRGNRPYIIAFVDARLRSDELANIFGSHDAAGGLAAVTVNRSTQYVKEAKRYCCYYLVRYTLSFINPSIKAHNDPARTSCYFHKKLHKPDIRQSMDSGVICDADQDRLDNPRDGDRDAKRLSAEERQALRNMLNVVSGAYPYAIVMKGGGVKGLAFAAALCELQEHFYFDRHVGASAGAIAAVLLAAGYSPAELVEVFAKKNFRDFMDSPAWKVPINLLRKGGCYPGDHFFEWVAGALRAKIKKQGEIKMMDLNGAIIYATRRGPGTLTFDSGGERKDTGAAFATRCSMSIPLFFVPKHVDDRRVYDGGLRNNFPVSRFLQDHPNTPFIALYLSSRNDKAGSWMASDLLDILIEGEERQVVDKNPGSVVVIDTSPIGTIDFDLTLPEKQFLLKVGRAAALTFLQDRNLDDGPDQAAVQRAVEEAEVCRGVVRRLRKRRRVRNACVAFAIIALVCAFAYATLLWCVRVFNSRFERRRTAPVTAITAPTVARNEKLQAVAAAEIEQGWRALVYPFTLMLWQVHGQSVGYEESELRRLLEPGVFAQIMGLDIGGEGPHYSGSWRRILGESSRNGKQALESAGSRFNAFLDADLIVAVQRVISCHYLDVLTVTESSMAQVDAFPGWNGKPYPLGNLSNERDVQTYLKALLALRGELDKHLSKDKPEQ